MRHVVIGVVVPVLLLAGCKSDVRVDDAQIRTALPTQAQAGTIAALSPQHGYFTLESSIDKAAGPDERCTPRLANPFANEEDGVVFSAALEVRDPAVPPAQRDFQYFIPFLSLEYKKDSQRVCVSDLRDKQLLPYMRYSGDRIVIDTVFQRITTVGFSYDLLFDKTLTTVSGVTPGATDKVLTAVGLVALPAVREIQDRIKQASDTTVKEARTRLSLSQGELQANAPVRVSIPIVKREDDKKPYEPFATASLTLHFLRSLLVPTATTATAGWNPDGFSPTALLWRKVAFDANAAPSELYRLFENAGPGVPGDDAAIRTAGTLAALNSACSSARGKLVAKPLSDEDKALVLYALLRQNPAFNKDYAMTVSNTCLDGRDVAFLTAAGFNMGYNAPSGDTALPVECNKSFNGRNIREQCAGSFALEFSGGAKSFQRFLAAQTRLEGAGLEGVNQSEFGSKTPGDMAAFLTTLPDLDWPNSCMLRPYNDVVTLVLAEKAPAGPTARLYLVDLHFTDDNRIGQINLLGRTLQTLPPYIPPECRKSLAPATKVASAG